MPLLASCFDLLVSGNISRQHGHGSDFDCKDSTNLPDPPATDGDRGTVQWVLPAIFYNQFNGHTTRKRSKGTRPQESGRGKRSLYGDSILDDSLPSIFSTSQGDVKDIIFGDYDDSSDMFTGELTPEEKIWNGELTPEEKVWNADLPETLDPVMTFPDDYMNRLPLEDAERTMDSKKKKKKKLKQRKLIPPAKEAPQFSPGNYIYPPKKVKQEEIPLAASISSAETVQGKDMLKALEDNIEEKLHASLQSLMKNEENHHKEEMSLVSGLALENKVTNALASVEKEPFERQDSEGTFGTKTLQVSGGLAHRKAGHKSAHPKSRKKFPPGIVVAKTLPAPDHTIDSIDKPRLPPPPKPKNASTTKNTTAKPASVSGLKPNSTGTVNSKQAANSTSNARQNSTTSSPTSPNPSSESLSGSTPPKGNITNTTSNRSAEDVISANKRMEEDIIRAETIFQVSFSLLQKRLADTLHVKLHPSQTRLLRMLESVIRKSMHVTAWAMVKQVMMTC